MLTQINQESKSYKIVDSSIQGDTLRNSCPNKKSLFWSLVGNSGDF